MLRSRSSSKSMVTVSPVPGASQAGLILWGGFSGGGGAVSGGGVWASGRAAAGRGIGEDPEGGLGGEGDACVEADPAGSTGADASASAGEDGIARDVVHMASGYETEG